MPSQLEYALANIESITNPTNLEAARTDLINNITGQYDNVAQSLTTNLTSTVNASRQAYLFKTRTEDVDKIQKDIINNQATQNDTRVENAELAKRQFEINEWANSDKLDTLFVFQFLFVSLLFVTFVEYLKKKGIVSSGFTYFLEFLVLLVNILIIVVRSKHTRLLRDTRYWNKRKFDKYPPPITVAQECPTTCPTQAPA